MTEYSEADKKEIDRQLQSMRRHVLSAKVGDGIHLFPGLAERSDEIQGALWAAIGVIDKLRAEIGYVEPPEATLQVVIPMPTSLSTNSQEIKQRAIAPLRVMLVLKNDISDEDRKTVLNHIWTPPSPGIDPMGIPANQALKYALLYQRDDDAKSILDELEALPGVESASIIPSSF